MAPASRFPFSARARHVLFLAVRQLPRTEVEVAALLATQAGAVEAEERAGAAVAGDCVLTCARLTLAWKGSASSGRLISSSLPGAFAESGPGQ